jgi:hypothetical protein
MSKIKMSFSLILAIFLVGILSTAAFAKDPYGLKPVSQSDLSLLVPFTGNSADATDVQGRSFDVDLIAPDGTTVVNTYTGTLNSSLKGSVTVPAGVMTPGSIYTVKLYHTDDTAHATLLSKSSAVVEDPHNADMYKAGTDANGNPINSTHVDVTGTGLQNANLTGYNNTRKNRSGQKVHGFYQNNTNSCASCHQTHTAANGESLLFKDGVYSTCSACHDGTTGAYNSFAPVSSDMTSSIAGTFNVQTAGHNGSLHEADGSLKISAAPGGNKAGGQYDQEFDCASCHAAHGAGSAGENNLNTDPMGWGSVPYAATAGQQITYTKGHGQATITTTVDNKNGKLFTFGASDIIDLNNGGTIPTTETFPYILVKTTAQAADITSQTNPSKTTGNYFWSRAGVKPGDLVIQTYRWDGSKGYVKDYSLWNRELGYPYVANTVLKQGSTDLSMDSGLTIVWRDGFAFGPSVSKIDNAVVSIGIDVETTTDIASLYDSTNSAYIPDSGLEMSKYCASCHVDYASTTRTDNTGVYTTAHRHATLQDRLTCVRCHYAHGSEAQIMHDANDNTYYTLTAPGKVFDASVPGNTDKAISYFVDPNPSSALKRYTGMSVCYACHGKGEQFIGSPNTNKADTTTGEFLKGGDPGTTRTDISK